MSATPSADKVPNQVMNRETEGHKKTSGRWPDVGSEVFGVDALTDEFVFAG